MKSVKRVISTVLCIVLTFAMLPVNKVRASQAIQMNNDFVTIQEVSDIDNIVTGKNYTNMGFLLQMGELAIPIDLTKKGVGTVKFLFSFDKDFTSSSGTAYMCKEKDLNSSQRITDVVTINQKNTEFSVCLDGGQKYYLIVGWTHKDKAELLYDSQITMSVLYEAAICNESYISSSLESSTALRNDVTLNGFITVEAPNDFYNFATDGNERITLMYTFDGERNTSGTGMVTVMNQNKEIVTTSSVKFASASKASEIRINLGTLPSGIYWVKMNGLYGATTLRYSKVSYTVDMKVADSGWKSSVGVDVKTDIDYSEMLVVGGKVAEADKTTTSVWRNATRVTDNYFTVSENGVYTVRVYGTDKTYTLGYITVSNVDSTAPTISGVSNGGAYRSAKQIKYSDNGSGLKTAKVNSFAIASGARVSDEGSYSVNLTDKAGNSTTIKFYIDYTKPNITGVANGGTYGRGVEIKYTDNLTGLKSVTLDNKEIDFSRYKVTTVNSEGSHTIIAKDYAGNTNTIKFTVVR